jgi:hypothetical protein
MKQTSTFRISQAFGFILWAIMSLFTGLVWGQNVGIGRNNPLEKLHVAGWIRSDSLAGPDSALVIADPLGTLRRFPFSGDPATVLLGNGNWGPPPGSGSSGYGDFSYPDGFDGITPISLINLQTTPYVVPAGKNLYISQLYSGSANETFRVDGKVVYRGFTGFGSAGRTQHLDQPIILGAGQAFSATANDVHGNGFLINSNVTPRTINNLSSTPYTVPAGKVLVILNFYSLSSGATLVINGVRMFYGYSNWGDSTNEYQNLGDVLFVGPGQTLTSNDDAVVVNGYLRNP